MIKQITPLGSSTAHDLSARYMHSPDTRATVLNPNELVANKNGIQFDFKLASVTGLTGYSGVLSYRPYASNSDWSGGPAHLIAFNNSNGLYWRVSTGDTTWGDWKLLVTNSGTWGISITGNAATATTATKATNDSDGNAINTTYLKRSGGLMTGNITGNSTATIGTTTLPFHLLVLGGTTTATMTAASTNPRITFLEGTGTLPVHLIYSDYDSYRSPAGLKIIGGDSATPAWLEVEGNVYAAAFKGNADTATKLSSTPNNTTTFLRGDNTWSNSLTGSLNATAYTLNGASSAGTNYITGTAGRIFFGGNFHIDSLGSNKTYINYYTANDVTMVSGSSLGKVGIGTVSPSYKLHVVGTGYFSDVLTANASCTSISNIKYYNYITNAGGTYIGWIKIASLDMNTSNHFGNHMYDFVLSRTYNSPSSESYHIRVVVGWETVHLIQLGGSAGTLIIQKFRVCKDNTNHKAYFEYYVDPSYTTYQNQVNIRIIQYYGTDLITLNVVLEEEDSVFVVKGELNLVHNKIVSDLKGNADTATRANITTTANSVAYYSDATGTFASDADFLWDSTNNKLTAANLNGYVMAGLKTGTTLGLLATAEGNNTTASGKYSHAEGSGVTASGNYSHAEGYNTTASGHYTHAEGSGTTASKHYSHAEGSDTTASGYYSHAEGLSTTASGDESHAEGGMTTASGTYSHAEGLYTIASGKYSHAEGYSTTAQRRSLHVFGEYNILDTTGSTDTYGDYIEIVGNGTFSTHSNARTLDWNGNESLAGNLLPMITNSKTLGDSNYKWADAYITTTHGDLDGNADTATLADVANKLGTTTVGSFEQPIYLSNGTATETGVTKLLEGATLVAKNEDLNTFATPGNYAQTTSANAKTNLNTPFGAAASSSAVAFRLTVESTIGTTYRRLFYESYNGGLSAERTSTDTGANWSLWRTKLWKNSDATTTEGSASCPVYINGIGRALAITSVDTAHGGTGNTSFTANRLVYSESATKLSSATSLYATKTSLGVNTTSLTNISLILNLANTLTTYTPSFLVSGKSYHTDTIAIAPNIRAIEFRPNNNTYSSYIYYGTSGNEALNFVNRNTVTSFLFWTGNSVNGSAQWYLNESGAARTDNPAVQIKKNSLYINKLLPTGSDPGFKFYVNGKSRLDGDTDITQKLTVKTISILDTTKTEHLAFSRTGGHSTPNYINIPASSALAITVGGASGEHISAMFQDTGILPYSDNTLSVGTSSYKWADMYATTFHGALDGNASTATTLLTARTINGTSFDGSDNITTANWGTARNIYIADNSATNTGPAVSVNGSANATLKLPATIKATLTGAATDAANTQSNYGAKSFIVEGDADTYYPTLITGATAHNAWTLLNITRGYSEQAPDTWNNSSHRGGLTMTILTNGDTAWGGNHQIGVTKLNTILDLSLLYCTMVGDIQCTNFGLVIWLRGGTAKYWITSNGGQSVNVVTYYESHTLSSHTVVPITTVNTTRIDSYRWNNLWTVKKASLLATSRTIALTGDVTGSGSFNGTSNLSIATSISLPYGATLPTSGTEGNIFLLTSAEYYELPTGGSIGLILAKKTAADRNVQWIDPPMTGINVSNSSSKFYPIGTTSNSNGTINTAAFNSAVYVENNVLFGAAWNDYAEFRKRAKGQSPTPGQCVKEVGDGSLILSTKRLERGSAIVSDTYGFAIGKTDDTTLPIAVTGRVLAFPYESIEEFSKHIGWPVCSGPNGTVSIMTEEEEEKYPSRIIGIISEIPIYKTWGENNIEVNGRVWIRIK